MRRINILGSAGSGKSTLARRLGEKLHLPIINLDRLFWEPGWQKADKAVFRQRVEQAVSGEAWICEGNYASQTFALRMPRAELTVWLDTPRLICALRVAWRSMRTTDRPDLPAGCREGNVKNAVELVRDAWQFDAKQRARIEAELAHWSAAGTITRLRSGDEIADLLSSIRAQDR
ncbi:AAA family ATPase [Methylobacterium sp. SyP6R]|uniref:AAA family ATPase n=1 Tax=Methylobacterium sp. SyP6R TaxID=2718876 RepID=UPI001F39773E|nr:AAA family ATPase [Methylobacterium sp. SyP6R]MCF4126546.1 AAA family ATPase [Methylobacterium sp. SyP6R]